VSWTENGSVVSPSASYTFTLNGNRTLVANFTGSYTIAVSASPVAGGTVGGGGTFTAGSSQTVTAAANPGYIFVSWTENGSVVSPSASYTFTLNGNRTLVANFTVGCLVTVTASPPAGGTVGGGGSGCGSSVTLTAAANPGYTFVNWTEGGSVVSPSATFTFTLDGNRTIVANFTPNPAVVITNPIPGTTLSSSSVTFQWSGGTGVSEYFFYVGTAPGGGDIYSQSQGLNLSATVSGLPVDGSTLYATLWWSTSGVWQSTNATYTAWTRPSGPTLSGNKQGGNMVLSWATNATGYSLQATTNLGTAAVWGTVSPPPVVVNGQNVVTTPASGPRRFFRLMHP
jgi:uncharacterized repeat protein (TIGR02543 family)